MTYHLYSCFNFVLRSQLPLTELFAVKCDEDDAPIVEARLEPMPEILPGSRNIAKGVDVAGDEVLLTMAGTARYLVRGGKEILIDPDPQASPRNVRLFLLGSALGIICHQRGLLPIHANAIVSGGAAYAFGGVSGSGKSTLAAYLSRAGYQLLTDDVCVIGLDDRGKPMAWPGLPRIKLWGDASAAFGHDVSELERVIEDMDKYQVPFPPAPARRAVPFRRLYLLSRAEEGEASSISPLRGQAAMQAVMANTYRRLYVEPMGLGAAHFQLCAALLSHSEVFEAKRGWGYDIFDQEAAKLENHFLLDELEEQYE